MLQKMLFDKRHTLTPESDTITVEAGLLTYLSFLRLPRENPSDICAKTQRELQQRVLLPNFTAFPNSFTWCKGTTYFFTTKEKRKNFLIIKGKITINYKSTN